MTGTIGTLLRKLDTLETELEVELAKRRAELGFGLERGKIIFEEEVLRRHREMKMSLWTLRSDQAPMRQAPSADAKQPDTVLPAAIGFA